LFRFSKSATPRSSPNVTVLDTLHETELARFGEVSRTTAFFLMGMRRRKSMSAFDAAGLLLPSPLLPLAAEFVRLTAELAALDRGSGVCHEFIADGLIALAELFRPSPDCRVKTMLELAAFHQNTRYFTEAAVTEVTAASVVAEHLALLGWLPPAAFSPADHPARAFADACPPAAAEIADATAIVAKRGIRGFYRPVSFSEAGLRHEDPCTAAPAFGDPPPLVHLAQFIHAWGGFVVRNCQHGLKKRSCARKLLPRAVPGPIRFCLPGSAARECVAADGGAEGSRGGAHPRKASGRTE
jgi:hypothetical protein